MKGYKDKELLDKVKSLQSFKGIPKGKWLLGMRSTTDTPNRFDDKIYLFDEEKFLKVVSATTNPGLPSLKGGFLKYNSLGSAVVKSEEWYYDVWAYGLHNSKMKALKQVGNFLVYRDGDKDGKAEEIGRPYEGKFGINFHTISYNLDIDKIGINIGEWSHGCQVVNDVQKYVEIIDLVKDQKRVSYCLIKEF
jgi:hypothetical protein